MLDTNIYVAAFGHPKGHNAKLLAAARSARYQLLISPAIVRELARVLRSTFQWQDEQRPRLFVDSPLHYGIERTPVTLPRPRPTRLQSR